MQGPSEAVLKHLAGKRKSLNSFQIDKSSFKINIQQLASNQDFSLFGANRKISNHQEMSKKRNSPQLERTMDLLLSG